MSGRHDPYAALRHPSYCGLLAVCVAATVAARMQAAVVGWELYERTDSRFLLGLVGLVQFLPVLVLFLPAGHAIDRYSRKWLLLGGLGGLAAASLGLTALSFFEGPVLLVFACLLLAGVCRAFSNPARWALLPQVVPAEALANAVTWNSSGMQMALVVGPLFGGAGIRASGDRAWPVYLAAGLIGLTCAALLLLIRPQPSARPREEMSLASLLAGVKFVARTRPILATITLDLFAALFGGVNALLPVFAKDILEVDSFGLGCLWAAPPVGAVVMAAVVAHRPPFREAGVAMLVAVAGYGLATIGFGLSTNVVVSVLLLALAGAADNVSVVVRGTLVQVLTPDAMRGRVSAVNALFIDSSNYLGDFESGVTADWFGPVLSVVGGGVGAVLVVLAAALAWPEILRLGPLHRPGSGAAPAQITDPAAAEPSAPPG
jgi:hypothetical protein